MYFPVSFFFSVLFLYSKIKPVTVATVADNVTTALWSKYDEEKSQVTSIKGHSFKMVQMKIMAIDKTLRLYKGERQYLSILSLRKYC